MNVVAITIRVNALNSLESKTPLSSPMRAKMSPTSPRGIMPTPMTFLLPLNHGAAKPAANLVATATNIKRPPTTRVK